MKAKRLTKKEMSDRINALLVWSTAADSARDKNNIEGIRIAMRAFNNAAQDLIDAGIPVHIYKTEGL